MAEVWRTVHYNTCVGINAVDRCYDQARFAREKMAFWMRLATEPVFFSMAACCDHWRRSCKSWYYAARAWLQCRCMGRVRAVAGANLPWCLREIFHSEAAAWERLALQWEVVAVEDRPALKA
eukprot:11510527-Alexandrium_andersonii.AAC.1